MGRPKTIETEDLLDVAREVFTRAGAVGSTKEIARRAGVSEAALFQRFGSKRELFLAAMTPAQPDIAAMLRRAEMIAAPLEALTDLAGQILAYFRMALPLILPVVAHPEIGLEALVARFGKNPADRLFEGVRDYLARQQALGRAGPHNSAAAAGLLVSALHSIAQFEIMGLHGGASPPGVLDAMIETLWRGLAPIPDRRTE